MSNVNGLIFLSGGGDTKQANKIDEHLRNTVASIGSSRCLYIPIALDSKYYQSGLDWFSKSYDYLNTVDMVTNESNALRFMKNTYDLIYIGGGGTGKLLYELIHYGLDKFIVDHIKKGAIVYGGSAGAIVFGKTITVAPADEFESVKDNHGFNLLAENSVVPHFEGKFSQHHLDEAQKYSSSLIGISESSGLVFRGGKIVKIFNPEGIKKYQVTSG